MIDMSQFHRVFFDEANEHLVAMEALLLEVNLAQPDPEHLNAIFRAAHSIKGGAATFGFADLTDFTHGLENLLDLVRKGSLTLTTEMVDVCLQAKDALKVLLEAHNGGPEADLPELCHLRLRLDELAADAITPRMMFQASRSVPSKSATEATQKPFHTLYLEIYPSLGVDLAPVLEQLGRLGHLSVAQEGDAVQEEPWVLVFTSEMPGQEVADTLAFTLDPDDFRVLGGGTEEEEGFGFFTDSPPSTVTPIWLEEEGFGLFEPLPEAASSGNRRVDVAYEEDGFGLFELPPAFEAPHTALAGSTTEVAPAEVVQRNERAAGPTAESSIRVSTEKVDALLNLVGELVITQSMLMQSASELDPARYERLLNGVALLERNSRELQEAVMSIRMTPISFVFSRFPRVVRDLAGKMGKQVELKMVGENTELDKGFIEKLSDPLTHLVRNSLDHGIESPGERLDKGKSVVGRITLRASHQGSSIVIEVNDDGAGLNRERILAKAREQGMPVSDAMSDAEVWNLIFEPGFSTATEVTDVSGRGVGMDVVRKNIHALGGRIEVDSLADYGSTIRIRLPLTLAIMDGMSVSVGPETYIFPLGFVLESLQPRAEDVHTVGGRGRVLSMRGEYVPIMALAEFFGIDDAKQDPAEAILIIVEAEGARAALQVDDLLGQQQFVVKNLETNYRKVNGVSGATIMGDGQVALILDVSAVVRTGQRQNAVNPIPATLAG